MRILAVYTGLIAAFVIFMVLLLIRDNGRPTYEATQDDSGWIILVVPPKCLPHANVRIDSGVSYSDAIAQATKDVRNTNKRLGTC